MKTKILVFKYHSCAFRIRTDGQEFYPEYREYLNILPFIGLWLFCGARPNYPTIEQALDRLKSKIQEVERRNSVKIDYDFDLSD